MLEFKSKAGKTMSITWHTKSLSKAASECNICKAKFGKPESATKSQQTSHVFNHSNKQNRAVTKIRGVWQGEGERRERPNAGLAIIVLHNFSTLRCKCMP